MRQLIKVSFVTLAVGAFMWVAGAAYAMPVPVQGDIKLSIGGFAGASTAYLTPHEQASGETPPGFFASTIEGRINLTAGTDTLSATIGRWVRQRNTESNTITWGNESGFTDYKLTQVTWNPGSLRIDAGTIVYLPWSDRAIQWEWFAGVGPLFPTGTYIGYPENDPGLDVTFKAGAVDVGIALFTQMFRLSGGQNQVVASAGAGADGVLGTADDTSNGNITRVLVPHVTYASGPLKVALSIYSWTTTSTVDGWANTDDVSNSGWVVYAKYAYDDAGSFVAVDLQGWDGDSYGTGESVIDLGITQKMGSNAVFLEYDADTASGGVDGVDQSYLRIGYSIGVAAGSDVRISYEMQDDSNSTASALGLTLFQSF